ncbi:MAG TPA: hypothetical protein DER10_04645 [Elusimicrobia bacterium]|nr:hypothetical protein [Elusimicrobiota bacterium]HCE97767.1 hypothetical protein [Elusimicrobiota bacterium]
MQRNSQKISNSANRRGIAVRRIGNLKILWLYYKLRTAGGVQYSAKINSRGPESGLAGCGNFMAKSKKILLVNPLENYSPRKYDMYPSGALVLMGTMAHNKGHSVKIVHQLTDGVDLTELGNILSVFKPDIVGITMNTFQTFHARKISELVKKTDKNILVVTGGPHPSALKLKIFEDFPCVDVAVIGEGEAAFMEIVEGGDLSVIPGICFNNKMNPQRPAAMNLDYIPLPNLNLVNFSRNKFTGAEPVGAYPTMYIMASRGCPFHCIYCNKSVWGNTVRFRRPELILEEIKWLHEKYGVKEIFFQDDTFNLNREWAEQVFNLIIANGLNRNIIYKTPFRVNEKLVDKKLLELAKKAGFWLIFYGVESGNQEMLDKMKKGITIREVKRAFELTHSVGLKTIASFIVGLPGETKKTIEDTFNLQRELKPYFTGSSPAIPFPDTEFEKIVIEKGHLLIYNHDEYCLDKFIVRTDDLSKTDLEYYRLDIPGKLRLSYLKWVLADSFKNPGNIIKRGKKFFNLLVNRPRK